MEDSLYNWKVSYKMKLLFSSFDTHGEFIFHNVDKIAFIFNTCSGFLLYFEGCVIYCFLV